MAVRPQSSLPGTSMIAINIVVNCDAGNYVYIDDFIVKKMFVDPAVNLINDSSFEYIALGDPATGDGDGDGEETVMAMAGRNTD